MPQDGSNNYQYPPGTPGIPDTTIESEAYNTFLDDLVLNDLNIPRPLHRGGTGASTADAALVNLKAEKAEQVVTAYLSHLWMPGSFRSAIGATDAPVAGHAFAGICYINEPLVSPLTNANVTVEARDQNDTVVPGKKYIRQKIAGVWSAWAYEDQDVVDLVTTVAPFDAMSYSGMQINGGMEVSQEKGFSSSATSGMHACDGWRIYTNGTVSAPTGSFPTAAFPGFSNCLAAVVFIAQPSMGAGEYCILMQNIEGYRVSRLAWGTANAKPITLSFWSQHTRPGVYTGTIRNGVPNRSYGFTYTHAAADTPQYNTITIPGDQTGTWTVTSGVGMGVIFAVACGSSLTLPAAGVWTAGSYFAAPGQINGVAATSDRFRITGVTVLPGTQAPTAAQSPLIMRPYDQELATCKRYWRAITPEGAGAASSNIAAQFSIRHDGMRAAPTILVPTVITLTNAITQTYTQTSPNGTIAVNTSETGIYNFGNFTPALTGLQPLLFYISVIQLDARL